MKSRCVSKWGLVLSLLALAGCGKTDLYTTLPEKEANEIISLLAQQNIPAQKMEGKEGAFVVKVSVPDFAKSVDLLNAHGYPRVKYQTIGQVFAKAGLVSSPLEERARFMYALSEDISATLCDIPGVLTARVHLVLPENDPYTEVVVPSSAAVCITYRPDANLEDYIKEIKYLVTNSIEGLEYDRVSVALFPANFSLAFSQDKAMNSMVRFLGMEISPEARTRIIIILSSIGLFLLLIIIFFVLSLRFLVKKRKAATEEAAATADKKVEAVALPENTSDEK
ncbi:MAG: type III secretion inner membrane ring lipoprotein SctJ [Puniceicoccales bacterium]|nr:type III secretion inner membrane ring lipoprotein SctJ [Puniceicoccales bacterium]